MTVATDLVVTLLITADHRWRAPCGWRSITTNNGPTMCSTGATVRAYPTRTDADARTIENRHSAKHLKIKAKVVSRSGSEPETY